MELDAAPGVHLTYCTNIHPAQTWTETRQAVEEHLPRVKARVAADRPMGVGLRLSAEAAASLRAPHELDRFSQWLDAAGLYVFTLNGFPYGPFHGTAVKQRVYRPDWSEAARVAYTEDLAAVASGLVRAGMEASISTVPGCFKPRAESSVVAQMTRRLLVVAAGLWKRRQDGGPHVSLALEPEPCCFLETIEESVAFFEGSLLSPAAIADFATATGLGPGPAEQAIRDHLGICIDTCHAAVEFEDPIAAVTRLQAAGIRIPKIQVTAGLRLPRVGPDQLAALRAFADPVYLHQVVARTGQQLTRYVDLEPALAAEPARAADEWRVHFHVPVFQLELGPFESTQGFLTRFLQAAYDRNASRHLEVETYTWDVLPQQFRTTAVDEAIARELRWVAQRYGRP